MLKPLGILLHESGFSWDEALILSVGALFCLLVLGVWLFSRRFKPVLDNEQEDGEPTRSQEDRES